MRTELTLPAVLKYSVMLSSVLTHARLPTNTVVLPPSAASATGASSTLAFLAGCDQKGRQHNS